MPIIDGDFLSQPDSPEIRIRRGDEIKTLIQEAFNSSLPDNEKDDLIRKLWPVMEKAYGEEKSDIPYFGEVRILKPSLNSFLDTTRRSSD